MTLAEAIAFWIFIVMTVGFAIWVGWLAIDRVDANPHRPTRKEDGSG